MNKKKRTKVKERLNILENETQKIILEMKEMAERECKEIAVKLTEHLNDNTVMEKMLHWCGGELLYLRLLKKIDNEDTQT